MQSLEITGLKELTAALDAAPDVIRQAKAEFFEEAGARLLTDVQIRIGGPRVSAVQEYRVGSGKGYVAVRAMADTDLDGYAAGYVTNALENGHAIRQPTGNAKRKRRSRAKVTSVPGKHMYRDTREAEAQRVAETGARQIESAIAAALNGG